MGSSWSWYTHIKTLLPSAPSCGLDIPVPLIVLLLHRLSFSHYHNITFAVKSCRSGFRSFIKYRSFANPSLSSPFIIPPSYTGPSTSSTMLSIIAISSFLYLLPTAVLATHEPISGSGTLPPYPTYSAPPYPMSNSTIPTYPTATAPSPPPTSIISPTASSSTSECPPPVTVTVTDSTTVTTTITTSKGVPFPTGSGTGGTAAPTGIAAPTAVGAYYRRSLEMRGLNYREGRVGWNEKRSSWWSWF